MDFVTTIMYFDDSDIDATRCYYFRYDGVFCFRVYSFSKYKCRGLELIFR